MKLMPASSAASTIRIDSASSVGSPKFIAPRHSAETWRSVLPNGRSAASTGLSSPCSVVRRSGRCTSRGGTRCWARCRGTAVRPACRGCRRRSGPRRRCRRPGTARRRRCRSRRAARRRRPAPCRRGWPGRGSRRAPPWRPPTSPASAGMTAIASGPTNAARHRRLHRADDVQLAAAQHARARWRPPNAMGRAVRPVGPHHDVAEHTLLRSLCSEGACERAVARSGVLSVVGALSRRLAHASAYARSGRGS